MRNGASGRESPRGGPRRAAVPPRNNRVVKAFAGARLILLGRLLLSVHLLLVHGLEHGEDELLALVPALLDLPGERLGVVVAGGKLEVLADVAGVVHQAEEPLVVQVDEGVILARHDRHLEVVGRRHELFVFNLRYGRRTVLRINRFSNELVKTKRNAIKNP